VAADLCDGRVRPAEARDLYGVVAGADGSVDEAATEARRATLRRERLAAARPPVRPASGTVTVGPGEPRVIEGVALVAGTGGTVFACAACGAILGDAVETYRLGCRMLELAMTSISELYVAPSRETGQDYLLRSYLCPGCGLMLDAHLCRPGDDPYPDVRVPIPAAATRGASAVAPDAAFDDQPREAPAGKGA
jgi:N-methylhydantoinase B